MEKNPEWQGIAFVVFDSGMAARRACGLSGEMFKARMGIGDEDGEDFLGFCLPKINGKPRVSPW